MASTSGPFEGTSAHNSRHGTPDGLHERAEAYRPSPQCPSECTGCDPRVSAAETGLDVGRSLEGGALVLAAFCYFLLPLAAALLGAFLAGEGALRQLFGAGGGLLAATGAAAFIAARLGRRPPERP